jgi:Icc-related predicted phosphoesterase
VLAVSDEVDELLRHDATRAGPVDIVLACGDLPFEYLAELVRQLDVPLAFVPGNHDPDVSGYRLTRRGLVVRAGLPAAVPWPDGAANADGRIVDVAGLRIAGLGGSVRYSDGPNQYTQRQQRRRARRLARAAGWRRRRDGHGVDVVITHAPPLGVGDDADPAHQGFASLVELVARVRPALLLHGHVAPVPPDRTDRLVGSTVVRNVVGWRTFTVEPGAPARPAPAEHRAS